MKQRITLDQLNELSEEQRKKLPTQWVHQDHDRDSDSWCYTCGKKVSPEDKTQYEPALLTIGQTIEILEEKLGKDFMQITTRSKDMWGVEVQLIIGELFEGKELCDALFEAVKEVL